MQQILILITALIASILLTVSAPAQADYDKRAQGRFTVDSEREVTRFETKRDQSKTEKSTGQKQKQKQNQNQNQKQNQKQKQKPGKQKAKVDDVNKGKSASRSTSRRSHKASHHSSHKSSHKSSRRNVNKHPRKTHTPGHHAHKRRQPVIRHNSRVVIHSPAQRYSPTYHHGSRSEEHRARWNKVTDFRGRNGRQVDRHLAVNEDVIALEFEGRRRDLYLERVWVEFGNGRTIRVPELEGYLAEGSRRKFHLNHERYVRSIVVEITPADYQRGYARLNIKRNR